MVQAIFPRINNPFEPEPEFDSIQHRGPEHTMPDYSSILQAQQQNIAYLANRCLILETMLQNNWGEDEYKTHYDGAIEQHWPKPKEQAVDSVRAEVDAKLAAYSDAVESRFTELEDLIKVSFERVVTSLEDNKAQTAAAQEVASAAINAASRPAPPKAEQTPDEAPEARAEAHSEPSTRVSTDDVMTQAQWNAAQAAEAKKKGGKK